MQPPEKWAAAMAPMIDRAENAVAMIVSVIQQDAREDLEQKLQEANHWRARHSRESQLRGEQSQANWLRAKTYRAALERLVTMLEAEHHDALAVQSARNLLAEPIAAKPPAYGSTMPPALVENEEA